MRAELTKQALVEPLDRLPAPRRGIPWSCSFAHRTIIKAPIQSLVVSPKAFPTVHLLRVVLAARRAWW